MSIAMVGSMVITYSIAEEKEKGTLRTLVLANVTSSQVLIAKTITALVFVTVVNMVVFFLSNTSINQLPSFLAITISGALPIMLLSLLVGLISRDQTTASVYSMPILFLAMAPMFGSYSEDIYAVTRWTPCGGMADLLTNLSAGTLFTEASVIPVATSFVWIVAVVILFVASYKRISRDN